MKYGVQMPEDAKIIETYIGKNFQPVEIYKSVSKNFIGTQKDFIDKNLAYAYYDLTPSRRMPTNLIY